MFAVKNIILNNKLILIMVRRYTKQDSHYLVRYECDNNFQIRTAGFFQEDEEVCKILNTNFVEHLGH